MHPRPLSACAQSVSTTANQKTRTVSWIAVRDSTPHARGWESGVSNCAQLSTSSDDDAPWSSVLNTSLDSTFHNLLPLAGDDVPVKLFDVFYRRLGHS